VLSAKQKYQLGLERTNKSLDRPPIEAGAAHQVVRGFRELFLRSRDIEVWAMFTTSRRLESKVPHHNLEAASALIVPNRMPPGA
jgi:hypothetical protein